MRELGNKSKQMLKKAIKKCGYVVFSPFAHKRIQMDIDYARELLNDFSPQPTGRALIANKRSWEAPAHDLDIIVPAYNVEAYLRACIESILVQDTKYSYRVILIDDGSTDATRTIADEYADNSHVKVIQSREQRFFRRKEQGAGNCFWEVFNVCRFR